MKLQLGCSGGTAGQTFRGELDLAELPPDLALRAERHLRPGYLDAGTTPDPTQGNDREYEVTVFLPSGGPWCFVVNQRTHPPEVLGVLNELELEIESRQHPA